MPAFGDVPWLHGGSGHLLMSGCLGPDVSLPLTLFHQCDFESHPGLEEDACKAPEKQDTFFQQDYFDDWFHVQEIAGPFITVEFGKTR